MKLDNNLFHVTYEGREYYFTKYSYITRLTNLQQIQIQNAIRRPEIYKEKYGVSVELVDGSEIKYKYINVM